MESLCRTNVPGLTLEGLSKGQGLGSSFGSFPGWPCPHSKGEGGAWRAGHTGGTAQPWCGGRLAWPHCVTSSGHGHSLLKMG